MTELELEHIEKYLQRTCSEQERKEIDARMEKDPSFRKEVEAVRVMLAVAEVGSAEARRKRLNALGESIIKNPEDPPQVPPNILFDNIEIQPKDSEDDDKGGATIIQFTLKRIAIGIAAVIAAILLINIFIPSGNQDEPLADANSGINPMEQIISPKISPMDRRRNPSYEDSIRAHAINLISKGDWTGSISSWKILADKDPANNLDNYNLGLAYLLGGNPELAPAAFANVDGSRLRKQAKYYSIRALLKLGDEEGAKDLYCQNKASLGTFTDGAKQKIDPHQLARFKDWNCPPK